MTNQTLFIKQILFDFSHLERDPWSMNLEIGAMGKSQYKSSDGNGDGKISIWEYRPARGVN
jgi:hypothetical protein